MIKISKGPVLMRYSMTFGVDIEEVVDWVNNYVNHPELFRESEETESERLASIKGYIKGVVDNSVTGRMKCSKTNDARSVE